MFNIFNYEEMTDVIDDDDEVGGVDVLIDDAELVSFQLHIHINIFRN